MQKHHSRRSILYLLLVFCSHLLLITPIAFGQTQTGAIQGTVADATGAIVPDAEVTVTHTTTQRSHTVTTSSAGFYSAEGLLAGLYTVSVGKAGFKTYRAEGVNVDPGLRVGLNVTLEVGEVTQRIEVQESTVKVETEAGDSGGVITGDHIQQLMLNGRNYLGLALLVPGVNSASISGRQGVGGGSLLGGGLTAETPLSINGLGREYNNYTIDGTYNMNTGNMVNLNIISPLDTISEFRILKDNYSAKYGMSGSAQVMVETKSGTQNFHGAVYEFLRNDKLDASNFFAGIDPETGKPRKTPLKQNHFGFAFGGPFYIPGKYNTDKTKTFFFVNEEWKVRHSGLTLRGAMIPQAMRNGDFTNSPTLRSGGLQFDDVAANFMAQLYPGVNCLPDSTHLNPACFDKNAVSLMNKFWPLPNNPAGGFLNYINPGVNVFNQRDDTYRVDHYFSQKLRLLARFSYEYALDEPPAAVWGPNPAPTTLQTIKTTGYNAMLRFTYDISPTTINQFTVVGSHDKPRLNILNATLPSEVNINYPFPNANVRDQIPEISIAGGWAGLSPIGFPLAASDGAFTLSDDFSKVKGAHVLSAGALYIWGIKRQDAFAATYGSSSFSGVHTNDPVADFLLGLNSSFSQQDFNPRYYSRWRQFEPYFQDDWKVTPRLTLNLGLRYAYFTPDIIENDQFSDFDPKKWDQAKAPAVQPNGQFILDANGNPLTQTSAVADPLNGLVFPGKDDVPRGIYNAWKRGFAPRFGFAWDVTGNGKTALRGGYGIGYSILRYGIQGGVTSPPWVHGVSIINGTLTDPTLGTPGSKSPVGITYVGPPRATRLPTMVQSWSLTFQRELVSSGVLSVAYVGTRATNVGGSLDINFPLPVSGPSVADPDCLQPGQSIPANGFNFDPCLNRGVVSRDFTRPFVGWSSISSNRGASDYYGSSNYHSLQTGFQYKAGRDLTLNTAYTWGKTLSDVANRGFDGRNYSSGAQNQRNYRAEYGPPGLDRTHIFTAGYIYNLPFLRNRTDALGKVFGNWTFSGITVIESGFVLTPGLATGSSGLATRPNCVGNVEGPKSLTQWFNTAAFTAPPFGLFGNCGTGLIRGPGENNWNWALFKNFPISEKFRLQFRTEFFNVWNHPNFSAVSTDLGAGNFGQVTAALEERQIEFGLRLDW